MSRDVHKRESQTHPHVLRSVGRCASLVLVGVRGCLSSGLSGFWRLLLFLRVGAQDALKEVLVGKPWGL